MLAGKFREKMTNSYIVFFGRKHGVYDLWIECQKREIFCKELLYKAYTSKDRAMRVLYTPGWKIPYESGAGISSSTPNYEHEDKNKWRNGQVLCTFVSLFGS